MEIIILVLLVVLLDVAVLYNIAMRKLSISQKMIFAFIVVAFPIIGIVVYYLFAGGKNRHGLKHKD